MDGRYSSTLLLHYSSSRPLVRWLLRGGAAICIAAGGVLAVVSGPSAAAPSNFGQATEVIVPSNGASDPGGQLRGVSCSSTSHCVGVGDYFDGSGHLQAMEATETSGTFAQATEMTPPSNAASSSVTTLEGVSCPSMGNCVGTGDYTDSSGNFQAMEVTETGGSFAQATEVAAPSNAASNPFGNLAGVSCPSVGNCVGAGGYMDSSGNDQAMEVTETGGTFAQPTEVTPPSNAGSDPFGGLAGVSCPSVGNCVGVGSYRDSSGNTQAMEATETGGTLTQATEVTAPSNAGSDPGAGLAGVSCTSVGNCVAVGGYTDSSDHQQAMEVTETGGNFAPATVVAAPSNAASNPAATLSGGVSCIAAGSCVAVGYYDDSSGHLQGMEATETGGTFAQATEVSAPSNAGSDPDATLDGVSCTSSTDCVAVGDYTESSGHEQSMAAISPAAPPTTSVALPSNNAAVSGDTWLDAAASASAGFASVSFEVSGNSISDKVVSSPGPDGLRVDRGAGTRPTCPTAPTPSRAWSPTPWGSPPPAPASP